MNEEEKIKYNDIIYRLKVISNKIDNLNAYIQDFKVTLKNNVLINDKCYKDDEINNICSNLSNASWNIRNRIIVSLNNKIND